MSRVSDDQSGVHEVHRRVMPHSFVERGRYLPSEVLQPSERTNSTSTRVSPALVVGNRIGAIALNSIIWIIPVNGVFDPSGRTVAETGCPRPLAKIMILTLTTAGRLRMTLKVVSKLERSPLMVRRIASRDMDPRI